MNRFKKFMAGVTSAAMMLAGTAAFAMVPPDVAGTNIEEEAELLGALGIMVGDKESGNFRPDANIRRSEFAKIAVETLGLGSVAESNKAPTKFPDVVSDHWANGYINVAANQGLVIGDQYNNFRPDDNVSYAEAMTVLVRMLGHEPAAESKGQWPTGHLVVGSQIGVSKNVSSQATNAPISRATAAKMDFNSLTIKLMEQMCIRDRAYAGRGSGRNFRSGRHLTCLAQKRVR